VNSDVELFIGGQASQWIWKEKKEVWKYHIEYYNRYDKDKRARKYLPEWKRVDLGWTTGTCHYPGKYTINV
jgi:hypothetical protein